MAEIFDRVVRDKGLIANTVIKVIQRAPHNVDCRQEMERTEAERSSIALKKDRLLEMSMEGALSTAEFRQRNDAFNQQRLDLEQRLERLKEEQRKSSISAEQLEQIRAALEAELSFKNGIDSALMTTILDYIVVKENSIKENLQLDIVLKSGGLFEAVFYRENSSFCISCSRNITPNPENRTT